MLNIASASELPHVRIDASEPGPLVDVPELLRFRDLLWTLAERDLRVRYKQTALGVIWVVLQPLMAALIFAFVFGVIAGLPSEGEPYLVFAFAGMTAWNTFANVLIGGLGPGRFVLLAGPDVRDDGNLPGLARMGHRVLAGLAADPGGPGTRSGTDDLFVDGALSRRCARHSGAAPVRPVHQPGGLVDDEHQAQCEVSLGSPAESAHEPAGGVPVVAFRPRVLPLWLRSPTLWWSHLRFSGWE